MNPLLAEFLGAVARAALLIVLTHLADHHVITGEQADRFADAAAGWLVTTALPFLAVIAWSIWAKYRSRLKLLAARELPPGASDQQLLDHMKTFTVKDTFTN